MGWPLREHHDLVGQIDGLLDAVRHEHRRDLRQPDQFEQHFLHRNAHLRVQCREGLVHQQDLGLDDERAGDGHALLHAAGQLLGIGFGEILQAQQVQVAADRLPALILGDLLDLHSELDVLPYRQVREQRELLKHHSTLRSRSAGGFALQQDVAVRGCLQAGRHAQQGRLAAS